MSYGMPDRLELLFVLIATSAVAQTSGELSALYGNPDAERFVARPGISLMAAYTADRSVCEMMIEPDRSTQQSAGKQQSMATRTVTEIIDELIPKPERGIPLNRIIERMGAPEHQDAEYQNVTIAQDFSRGLPAHHDETSATIVRQDVACKPRNPSQAYLPDIRLTADDLHSRYGDSDVERLPVRSGISLTVSYGAHREVCQIVVEPTRSILPRGEPDKEVRPESLEEVLDEVLPGQNRGIVVATWAVLAGRIAVRQSDYENVVISRTVVHPSPDKPEMETGITVQRKESACQQLRK
jgi:hypothetical protein